MTALFNALTGKANATLKDVEDEMAKAQYKLPTVPISFVVFNRVFEHQCQHHVAGCHVVLTVNNKLDSSHTWGSGQNEASKNKLPSSLGGRGNKSIATSACGGQRIGNVRITITARPQPGL